MKKGGVMKRREFIRHAAGGMGAAALLGSAGLAAKRGLLTSLGMTLEERLAALPALPRKFAANETVIIGKTGIQTSLLAIRGRTIRVGESGIRPPPDVKRLTAVLITDRQYGASKSV